MSAGLSGLLAVQGVWFASVSVLAVPTQIPGGKGPLMRPTYDHLAEWRPDATGAAIRTIRSIGADIERTTRQEVETR